MKVWQKVGLVVVASAFPLSILGFNFMDMNGPRNHKAKGKKSMAFDEVMLTKSSELAEINLRIATVRGELLKFEASRKELIGDIGVMRDKLTRMVEVESKDRPAAQVPALVDPNLQTQ